MPYRRKSKKTYRKRPSRRRYGRKSRISKVMSRKVHTFKKVQMIETIVGAGIVLEKSYSFSLADLTNSAEFAALYDSYRISAIQFKMQVSQNASELANTTAQFPLVVSCIDYDDTSLPASGTVFTALSEYDNAKIRQLSGNYPLKIYFKPKVAALVYRTGVTNASEARRPGWMDMANLDVPHYGIKLASSSVMSTNVIIRVWATYYFQCKSVR